MFVTHLCERLRKEDLGEDRLALLKAWMSRDGVDPLTNLGVASVLSTFLFDVCRRQGLCWLLETKRMWMPSCYEQMVPILKTFHYDDERLFSLLQMVPCLQGYEIRETTPLHTVFRSLPLPELQARVTRCWERCQQEREREHQDNVRRRRHADPAVNPCPEGVTTTN